MSSQSAVSYWIFTKCIFVFSPFERILQAVNSFASFINTLRDMVAVGGLEPRLWGMNPVSFHLDDHRNIQ